LKFLQLSTINWNPQNIEQFKLARLAFQIEVLQNGLLKKIIQVVKVSATGDFDKALSLADEKILHFIINFIPLIMK